MGTTFSHAHPLAPLAAAEALAAAAASKSVAVHPACTCFDDKRALGDFSHPRRAGIRAGAPGVSGWNFNFRRSGVRHRRGGTAHKGEAGACLFLGLLRFAGVPWAPGSVASNTSIRLDDQPRRVRGDNAIPPSFAPYVLYFLSGER